MGENFHGNAGQEMLTSYNYLARCNEVKAKINKFDLHEWLA
jgi:hypothetical protein